MGWLNWVGLWLAAWLTLGVGLASRSLGMRGQLIPSVVTAVYSLACIAATWWAVDFDYWQFAKWAMLSIWVVPVAQSLRVAVHVGRAIDGVEPALSQRLRWLRLGSCVLALGEVGWALLASSDAGALALCLVVPYLIVSSLSALRSARAHAARGDQRVALVGWSLFAWCSVLLASPVLVPTELLPGPLAVALAVGFAPAQAFATWLMGGQGPIPRELEAPVVASEMSTNFAYTVASLLGALALSLLLLGYGRHLRACSGALVEQPLPPAWRDWPVTAEGDLGELGPFKLHASRTVFKSAYPAAYEGAALGDPRLCFGSTVSLAAWFEGDVYRAPFELRLRQSPAQDSFVVSGVTGSEPERGLVAFRRDMRRMRRFDSAWSRVGLLASSIAFVAGAAVGAQWYRRRSRALFRLGVILWLAALALCVSVERMWESPLQPRPGREIAEESSWLI
ncbi:MAG: hypothetical protein QM756_38880 [Polyangiaceae bacterium]